MSLTMKSTNSQSGRLTLSAAPVLVEALPVTPPQGGLGKTVKTLGVLALLMLLAGLAMSGLLPVVFIAAVFLLPALLPLLPLLFGLLASSPSKTA